MGSHFHLSTYGKKCLIGDHILVFPWNYGFESIGCENRRDTHLVVVVGRACFQRHEARLRVRKITEVNPIRHRIFFVHGGRVLAVEEMLIYMG